MKLKLDINTNWSNLPWQQIYNKINLVQRQIYKSAQYCNFNIMNKYQKYLCNCNEVKILAIECTIKNIQNYYKYTSNEIYFINDKDKFKFFKYLFTEYIINDLTTFILEKVKQYILYLCIEPEWKSKHILSQISISKLDISNIIHSHQYNILKKNIFYTNKYYCYEVNMLYKMNDKYTNLIQHIKYIQKHLTYKGYLCYWINNKFYYTNVLKNIKDSIKIPLLNLILNINSNILTWYKIYTNNLDKTQNILSINKYKYNNLVYMNCIHNIKWAISFKYQYHYLRKNISFKFYDVINKIIDCIKNIYNYSIFIYKDTIKQIYAITNNIIYYWCRKKYKKNIFYRYTYIHNKFLNQFFYQSKFNSSYFIYKTF
uniref:Reverse transcriptase N-terminal domain-containing protein n=1 Tax=Callithamnion tetricum TaxID=193179 RepID=A0A4D6WMH5_9FLOR|nr:hypothetical protein [Callithamnion tetricum]